jgi:hypothetical protein
MFSPLLESNRARIGAQILLNRGVLDYIQSIPDGIPNAAFILSNLGNATLSNDRVRLKILELAAIDPYTYELLNY